jgi:fluoride exporter
MNLARITEVGAAGAAGAVARYTLNRAILHRRQSDHPFPTGTTVINITGSLILGLLTGFVLFHAAPTALTRIAGSGFCGGYTTFSAASFETVQLHRDGDRTVAALYLVLTVAGTLLAAAAGLALASL